MSYARKVISAAAVLSVLLMAGVLLSGMPGLAAPQSMDQLTLQKQAKEGKAKTEEPLTEKELIKLVKHNKKHLDKVQPILEARGLSFELDAEVEHRLRKAGADEAFIASLKDYTPSGRAAKAKAQGPQVPQAEADAYNKLKADSSSGTPDQAIAEADQFVKSFPNSTLLSYVYSIQAVAYQRKNDFQGVVTAGEKSLKADPDNLMALLLVSQILPQPQMLNVPAAEKVKRLVKAETYANRALQEIDKLKKPEDEADAAFQVKKDRMAAGVYASLGMVHLERARMALQGLDMGELAKAEQSFRTAIAKSKGAEDPRDYFRLGEICSMENKVDAAIAAFTNAKKLAPGGIIEQYAERNIKELKQREAQAKKP